MAATYLGFVLAGVSLLGAIAAVDDADGASRIGRREIVWHSDYRAALDEARRGKAMVLLWFEAHHGVARESDRLEDLLSRVLAGKQEEFIAVRLTTQSAVPGSPDDKPVRILDHPSFAEMLGRAGIALIDMRDEASPHYHRVVSVYPFVHGTINERELDAMLRLPTGALTQRTLIWAVRTHAGAPASAGGEASPLLMQEAADHSREQASRGRGGHHRWEERFHQINARLPAGLTAQEVCAESWPGQGLVAAAQDCVHSWRRSSGHWEAVSTRHSAFGYDMQRGASGVWYATGIFARQR